MVCPVQVSPVLSLTTYIIASLHDPSLAWALFGSNGANIVRFSSVHWIVPTLAGGFLAGSMLLIFVIYVNYIVDTYTVYAASAIAANTIARYAFAASVPLFTDQMFDAMGIGGGGSLIAGCAALLAPVPFVFWKYGKKIRAKSKYTQRVEPAKEFEWNTSKDPTDYSLQDGDGTPSPDNAAEMGERSS